MSSLCEVSRPPTSNPRDDRVGCSDTPALREVAEAWADREFGRAVVVSIHGPGRGLTSVVSPSACFGFTIEIADEPGVAMLSVAQFADPQLAATGRLFLDERLPTFGPVESGYREASSEAALWGDYQAGCVVAAARWIEPPVTSARRAALLRSLAETLSVSC